MYPTKEIGNKRQSINHWKQPSVSLLFRYCFINLLALACFPLFAQANISSKLLEVKEARETAKVSGLKNTTPTNAKINIGSGFEQSASSSSLFKSANKSYVENNTIRGLLINDLANNNLLENITEAQTATSSENNASVSKTSGNNPTNITAQGSITEKVRSLAIMLSVVAIPPALVVGLLFYKVYRRNKRYAHRHVNHEHSWQS